MKTQTENVQRWDDIIFENRNKDYGAYAIRKDYKTRVLKAEAISIGIGALIFIIPILVREEIPLPVISKPDEGIVLRHFDGTVEPKITPPAPKPPKRMDASIIPTKVTTKNVPNEPEAPPSKDVTYVNESDKEDTTDGNVVPGTGNIEVPVATPPAPPYVLAPEVMPAFEGGMEGMMKFLQKKLRYPSLAQKQKEEGTVYVSFIISPQGEVTNVELVKGFFPDCDKEAMRVISLMTKWKPGMQNKMPVAVKMVLPIKFKLD